MSDEINIWHCSFAQTLSACSFGSGMKKRKCEGDEEKLHQKADISDLLTE